MVGSDDQPKPEKTAAPATATATTDTTPEADKSGGGNLTEPDAELAVGKTAHVTISSFSDTSDNAPKYPLDAIVLTIEKGSIGSDFKGIDLEPEQKASTPYYVTVRVKSTKKAIPTKDADPDIGFAAIDDRGQDQGSVSILGSFPRCEDKTAPKTFKAGDSYESCFVYLVPGGGSIDQVNWTGSDDYLTTPVVWK